MKIIFLILILFSTIFAMDKEFIVDKSYSFVEYEGSHFLHSWVGTSKTIKGSIVIDYQNPTNSSVDISIPIFSFDSNNGNRDSNMLLYVEEFLYPEVKFFSTSILQIDEDIYNLNGELDFHGIRKEIVIPIEVKTDNDFIYFQAVFSVNINEYNVERPKLLLTPISEIIEIRIQLRGTFKN